MQGNARLHLLARLGQALADRRDQARHDGALGLSDIAEIALLDKLRVEAALNGTRHRSPPRAGATPSSLCATDSAIPRASSPSVERSPSTEPCPTNASGKPRRST